jgi:methyl halide transferase
MMQSRKQPDPFQAVRPHGRGFSRSRRRSAASLFLAGAIACGLSRGAQSQARAMADLPEASTACRSLQNLLIGNTVLIIGSDLRQSTACVLAAPVGFPCAPDSPLIASEANTNFIYACADLSATIRTLTPASGNHWEARWLRRFIYLQPGIIVVDDWVQPGAANRLVQWRIACQTNSAVAGRQLRVSGSNQELICETIWPPAKPFQPVSTDAQAGPPARTFAVESEAGPAGARFLHVLYPRRLALGRSLPQTLWERVWGALWKSGARRESVQARVVQKSPGEVQVAISLADRVFQLELPSPEAGAGWIALADGEGAPLVRRRPLPSGNLPPRDLVEKWDLPFRTRSAAEWDKGGPALKLKALVERGELEQCRIVELGCGSGNDAIYLASQGFNVTGIDIAPTALCYAAAKAQAAGVDVNWVLADVQALPELGKFDFIFDRGCYHNVRYVNAPGFVASMRQLSHPGTECLILSLDRDRAPGVREQTMRQNFSTQFDIVRLERSGIEDRAGSPLDSWALTLRRKLEMPEAGIAGSIVGRASSRSVP